MGSENSDTNERLINNLNVGNYFGEVALMTNMKRTCTVKSLDYTTLACLSKEDFVKAEDEFPSIYMNFREGMNHYNDIDIQFRRNIIRNVPVLQKPRRTNCTRNNVLHASIEV